RTSKNDIKVSPSDEEGPESLEMPALGGRPSEGGMRLEPRSARVPRLGGLSHSRVEGAAVPQEVLAGDKARRGAAEEGAGVAELGRVAEPAGRVGLAALSQERFERDVLAPGVVFDARTQPFGEERSRHQAIQ